MNTLLVMAGLAEGSTGLVLLVYPTIVIRLLFGEEISGSGVIMSRIAGISLIALGVACWPNDKPHQALYGMFTYSFLAMLYLIVLAITGISGILLWPGVGLHAALSVLLVRKGSKQLKTSGNIELQ